MDFYSVLLENLIIILGTSSFAVSGAFAAMQKRLDAFGVLIVAFVAAVGGGTLRDLMIGDIPVFWIKEPYYVVIIIITALLAMFFWKRLKRFKIILFLSDSLGLGFFTILGLQKGLALHLDAGICIALGLVTGCFGGISRDILLNNIPIIFRKEIYATACIVGGLAYFALYYAGLDKNLTEVLSIGVIVLIRIIAVKKHLALPRFY
ncbi:trimeric intracellular cation channel family protein [Pseudopedobacter beijingensis]|uniref:Trimeric intracellular cation channel family protein n=1 Tax=Pseudopedobacter beijingensis TaxID=1207056 RepID=A0ABW4IFY9_9SPHI